MVVIAATNRKQDLDPALIRYLVTSFVKYKILGSVELFLFSNVQLLSDSRFDSMITFDLPDLLNRQEIAAQYAKHLKQQELAEFARATEE